MTTERFKISAGSLISILVPRFIIQWRDLIFIITIAMLFVATVRLEYALSVAMIICLIVPMGLLSLFAYYALMPEVCTAVLEKTATFSEEGVLFEYYQKVPKEDEVEPEYDDTELKDWNNWDNWGKDTVEIDPKDADEWEISHSTMFHWELFKGYERRKDMILLVFNDSKYKFLAIPYSAFVDSPQFTNVFELVKRKTSR